jgi:DNA-binding XRE family transcriptional regulator
MKERSGQMVAKRITHAQVKAELLKDPAFRQAYEELEPAYQLTRLRIQRGLTQQQLAERVGTTQSTIARLESGVGNPSINTLKRVAEALDGRLTVRVEPLLAQDGDKQAHEQQR